MPGDTREDRIDRLKKSRENRKDTSRGGRRLTSEEKRRRHRKRVIQVWVRRILALSVLILLIVGIVLGVRRLFRKEAAPSIYGLPSYVTEDYLQINRYSRPKVPLQAVNAIVIHYTGNPGSSAAGNRNYFNNLAEQDGVANPTYASSNFIVGLEGEVIACVPVDEVAYASNNRNEDSLSIETCHPDETGQFTEATYASLVKLTAYLCDRYGLTSESVIRHYDVSGKACPLYYVEHEDAWQQFRTDVQTAIDALQAEKNAVAVTSETSGAGDTGAAGDDIAESMTEAETTTTNETEVDNAIPMG